MKPTQTLSVRCSMLLLSSVVFATICGAQTTAVCKFTSFNPPSGYRWASPSGINDHGTIVGAALSPVMNSTSFWQGLVRHADGSMSIYKFPTVTPKNTWFSRMNNSGVAVGHFGGDEHSHGFVKSGNNAVKVDYPIGLDPGTWLYGINKFQTIVGVYITWNPNFTTGSFKLINGQFLPVKIFNATYTYAYAINDNGAIAGTYSKTPYGKPRFFHGFRLRKDGVYDVVDHPAGLQHAGTEIRDLNNGGVMVGNWLSQDPMCPMCAQPLQHGFIYKNHQFQDLAYPGAQLTTATGINNFETIVGTARMPLSTGGYKIVPFKATCQ